MKLIKLNKTFYIFISIFIILCILLITYEKNLSNDIDKIYIISGRNEEMEVNNGYIYFTKNKLIINGGTINYLTNLEDVTSYTLSYFIKYIDKDENIYIKSSINNSNYETYNSLINYELGECILNNFDDINYIVDNCYFSFEYEKTDGTVYQTSFKIYFTEVPLNNNIL